MSEIADLSAPCDEKPPDVSFGEPPALRAVPPKPRAVRVAVIGQPRTPVHALLLNAYYVDWLYDRANREIVEALLIANIRDMTPALAKQSYDLLLADKGGLSRDLSLDMAGIRTVLELRSKYGTPKKTLTDPTKYVDVAYHEKAFAKR